MLFMEREPERCSEESILVWGLALFLCYCKKHHLWEGTMLLNSSFISMNIMT
jgi:hypothetical protein